MLCSSTTRSECVSSCATQIRRAWSGATRPGASTRRERPSGCCAECGSCRIGIGPSCTRQGHRRAGLSVRIFARRFSGCGQNSERADKRTLLVRINLAEDVKAYRYHRRKRCREDSTDLTSFPFDCSTSHRRSSAQIAVRRRCVATGYKSGKRTVKQAGGFCGSTPTRAKRGRPSRNASQHMSLRYGN